MSYVLFKGRQRSADFFDRSGNCQKARERPKSKQHYSVFAHIGHLVIHLLLRGLVLAKRRT